MSERFPKTYVSAREFVESWDKEIYELTNLDYFIFLMINHLGNQIERSHLFHDPDDSLLALDFESIGTLCFNLGDAFEYYIENKYFNPSTGSLPTSNPPDIDDRFVYHERLKNLQSLAQQDVEKEHILRIELMDYVIFDTLLQFYFEEVGLEFEEGDREINEMAFFIEDAMIEFIRNEGKNLLQRPHDPATDFFERLIEKEEMPSSPDTWEEDKEWFDQENEFEFYESPTVEVEEVVDHFLEECDCNLENFADVVRGVKLFQEFLVEHAGVTDIYQLNEDHFLEFLSVWLVQRFVEEDESHLPGIFQALARFVTWLNSHYSLDYKRVYLHYYDRVKTEVPRVIKALKQYLQECNIFDILYHRDNPDTTQLQGLYEISKIRSRLNKTMDLLDIHGYQTIENVKLPSSAFTKLQNGDFFQATLILTPTGWEILEIEYIYPKVSKRFVY
ncbi:MAG: hypothetical protein D6748_14110 [Calditrichaeota bacterium]|nr:MAG: hypothetical protein D6748_14110 [Calditrichota bacterium]